MKETPKILVADDDQGILEVITIVLAEKGFQNVVAVSSGIFEHIKTHLPDLVLLDILLSGEDGREIVRQVRGHEATRHTPIIMLSAKSDGKKIAQGIDVNDFVGKPFNIAELIATVRKHL